MSPYIINKCNSNRAADLTPLACLYVCSFPDLIANAGLMPLMRDLGLQILTILTDVWEGKQKKNNFEVSPITKGREGELIKKYIFSYLDELKLRLKCQLLPLG